ncbi:hypothetical protein LCGC14_1213930 [marine sediment metagenome]|uniref:Uncharacterized protein n=1 Tax=marine sediment metagenome TaxID=412755 RepID=A0A0F9LDC0_9ZZZZ
MSNLGHGVHIAPPQPIEEAIAWHTVPAQLSALRKMLRDAQTDREAVASATAEHLEKLAWDFTQWLSTLQKQTTEEAGKLGQRLLGLEQAGQALACAQHDQLGELGAALTNTFHQGLDSLDKAQQARLEDERKLTTKQINAILKLVEGVDTVHAARNVLLSDRIHQLEQAPLKCFWRWLTRKGKKNGSTL